ncbi:MAG: RNA-guided pseudouridylation complex pseudouridine synthase subunit Cbf5, partial [Halobacteria archaeon]|nr:RNA-guided pseudouridylation complex pseudouridine synthase subunit Cbf5 [Halobacteria archaeon]
MSGERTPQELLRKGVVNIDKPAGPTSHEVADWVRDLTGVSKVSHTGTLDPAVTGCLPLLLGRSARISDLFR